MLADWCEDLSPGHRTYRGKKSGMVAETDGSLELTEQPGYLLGEFKAHERLPSKRKKGKERRKKEGF